MDLSKNSVVLHKYKLFIPDYGEKRSVITALAFLPAINRKSLSTGLI